ncbi:hypothetical protein BpHYR1_036434 [Brachionus plicatilis]|uniref:CFA20 domain-containing protein n=1 Tax=Brachionus plicatilis TaxID=10195 RepID=A0A3M7SLF8_BRAPC|nr:hypothetical protein BpHYR1_036434 [Brachionus plicatilis]
MLKNEFNDGYFFEIFNSSRKEPYDGFSLTGLYGIRKIFDQDLKSSVYKLEGSPNTTKISIPNEIKHGFSFVHRIIVFQIYVKSGDNFSLDLGVTDLRNNRRHLLFSTLHKDLNIQPLIARVPLKTLTRSIVGNWTNLVFDLSSIINDTWKNQTLKSIDSISICANCKLRNVFTLKNLADIELDLSIFDSLVHIEFPKEVQHKTLVNKKIDISLKQKTQIVSIPLTIEDAEKSLKSNEISKSNINFNEATKKKFNSENMTNRENTNRKMTKSPQKMKIAEKEECKYNFENIEDINDVTSLLKIPHPPPQSSRPISSSIRKIRLPITMNKNHKIHNNLTCLNSLEVKNEDNCSEFTALTDSKSTISNNILNESINDLIKVLKSNSNVKDPINSQTSLPSSENFSEITNLDDSGNTIIYSFSSKPKPVSFDSNHLPSITQKSRKKTNNIKTHNSSKNSSYDFQKYSNNLSLTNGFLKNCKNHDLFDKKSLIDSFEAQMLQEMRAEMENSNKNSDILQIELHENEDYSKIIKSPDIEYFEAFQRGLSDLSNPLEEIQTSEKYNFDVLTSSIEETSTSYSKKNSFKYNSKTKIEEVNNYQDEMNISLLSNLPAKSLNFNGEIPTKYSPILNTNQNGRNTIKEDIISEEPLQFDDSQADIDEISSDTNEEIDLLYDTILNCYYDPKTCTYYELNLS